MSCGYWSVFVPAALLAGVCAASDGFVTVSRAGRGCAAHGEGETERWWTLCDGDGVPFVNRGVGWVSPIGPRNVQTKVSAYEETTRAKYAEKGSWEKATVARLTDWGFNALGSDSASSLRHRGLRHTILLRMGAAPATWKRDPDDYIMPHLGRPCTAFPNVFSPKFSECCAEVAAKMCAPNRDDRDLTGYFIDNELAWWGPRELKVRDGTTLVDAVASLPPSHTARQALDAFAAARGESTETLSDATKGSFLAEIADRYFKAATAAIRAADPNHLVLGCRFAGLGGAHEVVWAAAGRYCDVVTVNVYPTVDFKTRQLTVRRGGAHTHLFTWLDRLQSLAQKPVWITEWSFPAKDSGLPCRHGAGQRLNWQGERARAAEIFVRSLLQKPYIVGYDYFMWVDMPNPGEAKDYPGEDCNYGLVSAADEPYPALTDMFRRVQKDAGWQVTVDGVPLVLEKVDISIKENNEPAENLRKKGVWYQHGTFVLDRPKEIVITCDRPLDALEVLPAKFAIKPERRSAKTIAFRAEKPFRLAFRPEGRVGALHLFALAPDPKLPQKGTPGVRYFGPGEHHVDDVRVGSDQTLVIDEGAVVSGHLNVSGTNVTVCGAGLVTGARFPRHKGPVPFSNAIINATNVTVRGVAFTEPYTWTLGIRDSRNVVLDGVRILGGRMINDDGIDVINSSDVTIRNCFIRTQDDNVCAKGLGWRSPTMTPAPVQNLLVEGCELWADQANNIRIGFECDAAYMRNLRFRDIDVLAYSPLPRKFEDIWCHAVIKAQSAEGMELSGVDVCDLRVHSDGGDICLVYLASHPTWTARRGMGRYRYTRGGVIRDWTFADIDVCGQEKGFTGWIYLKGRSTEEAVRNVRFENVRYFGRPVTTGDSAVICTGAVEGVAFAAGSSSDEGVFGPSRLFDKTDSAARAPEGQPLWYK